ncbi:pseudouridine synthase [Marinobacterium jannaschii]|uniref:pseudouridine synthase n=1 Tax=Marinobacterium jannaschii TaxID=64970 RepID=UPI000480B463|nr:pseudouridine synthase [Marinobacterium jannaschii]
MSNIILLNKPFQVLTQFTDSEGRTTLADYVKEDGFYAAGRLDYDSEGLLILTDDGKLQHHLAHPQFKLEKTYWVQIEGEADEKAIDTLRKGVTLKDGKTRPARIKRIPEPDIWQRTPPIRERKNQATSWLEIRITEGKNRQVRRMTAAVGFPTLRLIRYAIGNWTLGDLSPGQYRKEQVNLALPASKQSGKKRPSSVTPRRQGAKRPTTSSGRRARP